MNRQVYRLMEREINTMRLISANRQALQQAIYINQVRYVADSKREEERLQINLDRIRQERSEQLCRSGAVDRNWFVHLKGEERSQFEALHRQLIHWQQKLSLQEIDRHDR